MTTALHQLYLPTFNYFVQNRLLLEDSRGLQLTTLELAKWMCECRVTEDLSRELWKYRNVQQLVADHGVLIQFGARIQELTDMVHLRYEKWTWYGVG